MSDDVPADLSLHITLAEMRRDVADVARTVDVLSKHVLEGNGRDSILTRLRMLEEIVGTAAIALKDLTKAWEVRATEDQRGKWSLLTSVICALMTLAGVVFTAMVALGK